MFWIGLVLAAPGAATFLAKLYSAEYTAAGQGRACLGLAVPACQPACLPAASAALGGPLGFSAKSLERQMCGRQNMPLAVRVRSAGVGWLVRASCVKVRLHSGLSM